MCTTVFFVQWGKCITSVQQWSSHYTSLLRALEMGLRNWTLLLIKLMNLNNYCIGHCWSMLGIIMSFEESSLKCLSCKNEDLSLILGTHTEKLLWWQAITISMLKEVEMGLTGTHWTASLTNLLREFWATDKPCFVLF